MHVCVLGNVATYALVLEDEAPSVPTVLYKYPISIVLDHFHIEILQLGRTILENEITFWKKKMIEDNVFHTAPVICRADIVW